MTYLERNQGKRMTPGTGTWRQESDCCDAQLCQQGEQAGIGYCPLCVSPRLSPLIRERLRTLLERIKETGNPSKAGLFLIQPPCLSVSGLNKPDSDG
jgi:hypothetical protein